MKFILTIFFLLSFALTPAFAQEDAWSYTSDDLHPGEEIHLKTQEMDEILHSTDAVEDNDPLEPMNRGIFWFNGMLDLIIIEPLSLMYREILPEFLRERVGYILRNLSEPIVFVNNILQGESDDAGDTLGRFLINSTLGIGGIFDVTTDWGIPYKREDFGLTLASWGFKSGPYLVLPILGPSNVRDTVGRVGDYAFDPVNWWAYLSDHPLYSNIRTAVQILDAKADNIELVQELEKNSVDYYATIRTWYHERRKDLMIKQKSERKALDTPRPDDDD
jgi:phospholipid-binding lipoprotein MlaA